MAKLLDKKKGLGTIGENIRVIVYALLIAFFVRTVAYQPFNIPSGSMLPTLLVGDYLFVSKFSYGYSRFSIPFGLDIFSGRIFSDEPDRGDVAVFRHPPHNKVDFIKRIVGIPGDKIMLVGGILHVNGLSVKKIEIKDETSSVYEGQKRQITEYMETLPNGVSYRVRESLGNTGPYDNTPEYIVPKGHYFALGDNRDNSNDSRSWGYIPAQNLIGRAEFIFFSTDGSAGWFRPWLWPSSTRFSRIIQSIN
jgi:signal peptidase I